MDDNNTYTKMQRDFYNSTADIMAIENHRGHDPNPDYYGLLLKEVSTNPQAWKGKSALDFGCGIGRNVDNLLRLAEWNKVDGCDISAENIVRARKHLEEQNHKNFNLYVTTGTTLQPIADDQYDLVMSTIVFQHIAVHEIRSKLFQDIHRVMKPGALFSFQMAQYSMPNRTFANYYDNVWNAPGTNGAFDVNVSNPQNLVDDLQKFGFKNVSYEIRPEWDASKKEYMDMTLSRWIFVKAFK